jgi:lipopolysaccharide transport system permease protein
MESQESTLQFTGPQSKADIPVIRLERSRGWVSVKLGELWEYRELLYFLAWRDVKVRYKQTAIGAAWAILQPLTTMVIFILVFDKIANIPSDGLPYPIFAFSALLPWNFFANALNRSSNSVVNEAHLITKVYFPRLIMPLAATLSGLIDFAIAFVVLVGMMVWFSIAPTWGVLALPLFLLLALLTALSVGLWLSALNVMYRDVAHTIPFLTQIWMFASPIAYPVSVVPEKWRLLYSLNPMAAVIEGFRWALLGNEIQDFGLIFVSAVVVVTLFFGGIVYFKRMERIFADVA